MYSSHWKVLIDRVLDARWKTESGVKFKPVVMAYDTNGEPGVTDRSKEFFKEHKRKYGGRLFPVKGASSDQEKLVEESKPNELKKSFKSRVKAKNGNTNLFLLNTNKLKDIITANMQLEPMSPKSMTYSHELDDAFFKELQAEKRSDSGKWAKIGSRANEAFDCACYIWAILTKFKWSELETFGETFKAFRDDGNKPEPEPEKAQTKKEGAKVNARIEQW